MSARLPSWGILSVLPSRLPCRWILRRVLTSRLSGWGILSILSPWLPCRRILGRILSPRLPGWGILRSLRPRFPRRRILNSILSPRLPCWRILCPVLGLRAPRRWIAGHAHALAVRIVDPDGQQQTRYRYGDFHGVPSYKLKAKRKFVRAECPLECVNLSEVSIQKLNFRFFYLL